MKKIFLKLVGGEKISIFLKKWKNRNYKPPGGGRGKKIKDIVPFYWGKFN